MGSGGEVVVVQAAEGPFAGHPEPTWGWGDLAARAVARPLPGDHHGVLSAEGLVAMIAGPEAPAR